MTEDHKRKISEKLKGNKNALGSTYVHTDNAKEKIALYRIGKKHSESTKKKISESVKAKKVNS